MLRAGDLKRCGPSITWGSHTMSHAMLGWCGPDELRLELAGSRDTLHDLTDAAVDILSYPNGHFTDAVSAAAGAAGYGAAVAVGQHEVGRRSPIMALPRFDIGWMEAGRVRFEVGGAMQPLRNFRARVRGLSPHEGPGAMSEDRLSVILLLSEGPWQRALAHRIASVPGVRIVGIVLQHIPGTSSLAWIRKNLRRQPVQVASKVTQRLFFRSALQRIDSAAIEVFGEHGQPRAWPDVPLLEVSDINAPDSVAWMRARQPGLICVSGTRMIKQPIFDLAPAHGLLNLHTGISPFYKGGPNCTLWLPRRGGAAVHRGHIARSRPGHRYRIAARDPASRRVRRRRRGDPCLQGGLDWARPLRARGRSYRTGREATGRSPTGARRRAHVLHAGMERRAARPRAVLCPLWPAWWVGAARKAREKRREAR